MTKEEKQLRQYGKSLIGKKAQSLILTEITAEGWQVNIDPQEITDFEIVYVYQEPTLMVTLGGESVYEDTLYNIH